MAAVEERIAVGHRRVVDDDAPDDVALQRRRRGAEQGRHAGEGVEIVVDDHLAGDADHLAPGLDPVALLALADAAALELAALVDLLELRRLAELEAVDLLEVGGTGPPGDRHEGPGCRVIGGAQRLAGDRGQDVREVGGAVQRPGGDLVAAEPPRPLAGGFEQRARHLDQAEAAPLAGRLAQFMAAGIVAVQQRVLDRDASGLDLVQRAGPDVMRPGLDRAVTLGRLVDQRAPGLVEADAAADQVVGDAGVDAELARRIGDAGNALALVLRAPARRWRGWRSRRGQPGGSRSRPGLPAGAAPRGRSAWRWSGPRRRRRATRPRSPAHAVSATSSSVAVSSVAVSSVAVVTGLGLLVVGGLGRVHLG